MDRMMNLMIRSIIHLVIIGTIFILGYCKFANLRRPYRFLTGLLLVTFLSELLALLLKITTKNAAIVYHFFVPIEYCMLSIVLYHLALKNLKWSQVFIVLSVIAVCIFSITNILFLQSQKEFPIYPIIVSSVLCSFQGLSMYAYMIRNTENTPLHLQGIFWLTTGCFIFYSIAFFIFSSSEFMDATTNLFQLLFDILWSMNIIMYLFYGLSIYLEAKANNSVAK